MHEVYDVNCLNFQDHTKILLGKFGGVNSSLFQHCFKASSDGQCSSMIAADVEVHCACIFFVPRGWVILLKVAMHSVEAIVWIVDFLFFK